jgi:predicted small lipoprotein YifL
LALKYRIITLCLICGLTAACGQYGALYLPGQKDSKALKAHNTAPDIAAVVESAKP